MLHGHKISECTLTPDLCAIMLNIVSVTFRFNLRLVDVNPQSKILTTDVGSELNLLQCNCKFMNSLHISSIYAGIVVSCQAAPRGFKKKISFL